MSSNMPELSAIDHARAPGSRPAQGVPPGPPLLAGVACCRNLPAREGIGPAADGELADGFLLDGRFLIRQAIGRSKMSTIYRAEDGEDGGRSVAIKAPLAKIESDPVSFGRFLREERIGAMLNHPYLLRFVSAPKEKSRPYIVTEYLDGCTLACVLHLTRPLPEKDALKIAAGICQALRPMHDRGVIHRDLKPANVMIRRDQTLCLMDFGLATEIANSRSMLAALTPLFGTPEYMSPEQVRNQRNDERTDIYSLGVILYQMLAGVLPFQHEDPWKAAQMRATGDPVAPRKLNPGISPQAEEIVLRAMRRKPSDRYSDVAAFRAELENPDRVEVTGLSGDLQAPRWRLSLQGTPFLAGGLIGLGALLFLALLFLLLVHHGGAGR
jgi:serine/threonine-protein kinase